MSPKPAPMFVFVNSPGERWMLVLPVGSKVTTVATWLPVAHH